MPGIGGHGGSRPHRKALVKINPREPSAASPPSAFTVQEIDWVLDRFPSTARRSQCTWTLLFDRLARTRGPVFFFLPKKESLSFLFHALVAFDGLAISILARISNRRSPVSVTDGRTGKDCARQNGNTARFSCLKTMPVALAPDPLARPGSS